jgi:hypothetical protein
METGMQAKATGSDQDLAPPAGAPDRSAAAPSSSDVPTGGSRALVPLHSADSMVRRRARHYPSATFVAHLIAVDRRVPQLRMRRRAAPADAAAVYAAALTAAPLRAGRKLRRSV